MTDTDITGPSVDDARPSVVLLTGPTSGIGAASLARLLEHPAGPTLVLLARDAAALDVAVAQARRRGREAHGIRVDLADLVSVARAAAAVRGLVDGGGLPPLDAVVLNAGVQLTDRRRASAQGHELTFAVNVLAQHALLRGLEPALAERGHAMLLGSSTHRGRRASFGLVPDPRWEDPDRLARPDRSPAPARRGSREPGGVAYATSKLALVTLAHHWAERLRSSGRRLNVYDPGLVAGTGLGRDMRAYEAWAWQRVMPVMSLLPGATTPRSTARHLVALALADVHRDLHDGYVEIGRVRAAEPITFDAHRREALWTWCEAASSHPAPGPDHRGAALP
ncbi:MAG: SDR family NAD(P)-dependent oxidoreductase [Dermatophilaceae bacterium]